MKEAIIHPGPKVEIIDSPIPVPNAHELLIKVVVSGSNPKDWKGPEWSGKSINQGDDIAGVVQAMGDGVQGFGIGDRVAALHALRTPHGSYAEYAISPASTSFHLPTDTTFEEAATFPLAALTAAVALYARLGMPPPYLPVSDDRATPLVIYGAASAVGLFAVQWARRSNIHPLICITGRSASHVETFLDRKKGDTILDYREGNEAVVDGIKTALQGKTLGHAFDAVTNEHSVGNIFKVLDPADGKVSLVLPPLLSPVEIPPTVRPSYSNVVDVHGDLLDFGAVYSTLLGRALESGWMKPHPYQVIPGGLAGVEDGLRRLKKGEAHAVKYVFRIAETAVDNSI